jgi:AbrB family looped-hinge helix DNA binding protein
MIVIEERSRMSSKGQVVIPSKIRSILNIEEGDDIKFVVDDIGDLKLDIVKKSAINDLYGSLKPDHSNFSEFSEIREQSEKMKIKDYLSKRGE